MPRDNDFTLEFTLRQHTPLIHFQADQPGATLRATELKPKLDRFLIRHAFNNEIDRYKTFLIGYHEKREKEKKQDYLDTLKKALDYRIHIVADTIIQEDIRHKAYFANMGKKPHEKRKATLAKGLKITIASLHSNLLDEMKKHINLFFLIHNFGTRQTKGFGSFYLDKDDPLYKNPLDTAKKHLDVFLHAHYKGKKSPEVFKHVEVIYPLMKSGINFPDYPKKTIQLKNGKEKKVPDPSRGRGPKASYYKSFLFQYMLKKNIGNEKRFIKENFFKKKVRLSDDGMHKCYVRAMLGVASFIEFRDHERKGKIIYKHDKIKRFRSPVIFKIVDDLLLIFPETIHPKIFDTTYTFGMDTGRTDKNGNPITENDKNINTPSQFDLTDFLKQFAEHFNTLEIDKKKENSNLFDTAIQNARKVNMNIFEKKAVS